MIYFSNILQITLLATVNIGSQCHKNSWYLGIYSDNCIYSPIFSNGKKYLQLTLVWCVIASHVNMTSYVSLSETHFSFVQFYSWLFILLQIKKLMYGVSGWGTFKVLDLRELYDEVLPSSSNWFHNCRIQSLGNTCIASRILTMCSVDQCNSVPFLDTVTLIICSFVDSLVICSFRVKN